MSGGQAKLYREKILDREAKVSQENTPGLPRKWKAWQLERDETMGNNRQQESQEHSAAASIHVIHTQKQILMKVFSFSTFPLFLDKYNRAHQDGF